MSRFFPLKSWVRITCASKTWGIVVLLLFHFQIWPHFSNVIVGSWSYPQKRLNFNLLPFLKFLVCPEKQKRCKSGDLPVVTILEEISKRSLLPAQVINNDTLRLKCLNVVRVGTQHTKGYFFHQTAPQTQISSMDANNQRLSKTQANVILTPLILPRSLTRNLCWVWSYVSTAWRLSTLRDWKYKRKTNKSI